MPSRTRITAGLVLTVVVAAFLPRAGSAQGEVRSWGSRVMVGPSALPGASEYRLPPSATSRPRAATASRRAFMARGETEVSTNTAGSPLLSMKFANFWTSAAPASEAVLTPSRPRTSKP